RLTHPMRAMGVRVDIMPGDAGFGTVNSMTGQIAGGKTGIDERASNAVAYISPTFGGGFSGTVAYVNGEHRTNDVNARAWQIAGQYDNGPIFVGLGYHKTSDWVPGDYGLTIKNVDARVWRLAAVYTAPFGTKFSALYDNTKVKNAAVLFGGDGDIKRAAWSIGASHPFGAHTVGLQYARSGKTSVSGIEDPNDKANIWSALYTYSLSKRTMVHARYSRLSNNKDGEFNFYNNAVGNPVDAGEGAKYTGFMVGLRHSF
ncbi:MAG: porin, partial [Betaproteobacteria bacterium]|nr:porin [Betaproteobacteria bacterium]